jgi:actin-related protein
MRIPLAGKDISDYLSSRLLPLLGFDVNTSAERYQVYHLKESCCFVKTATSKAVPTTYTLPSGDTLSLTDERHLPCESLFDPINTLGLDYHSIQQIVVEAIQKCPEDLHPELFKNLAT